MKTEIAVWGKFMHGKGVTQLQKSRGTKLVFTLYILEQVDYGDKNIQTNNHNQSSYRDKM